MSVLMRRENTLIIEPGSDISKIQIINFILLPNSKKHFEGPPLYKAAVTEANEFESMFLELMNKDDKESQKVEVENQLVPNFHQVVMLNSAGKHYKTAARLFNCSHYIINSGGNNRGDSCSYCMRSGHVVPHFRGQ
ncbi:Hypothetical_protein [Hexamita inflata]|uniref:Hypothetical_protein n=1 Tax=Hexamita inflata TaxID=28002 RepID=A0AA86NVP8_9EUKA|nr:Hypothetical protein HINF_LOCUS13595 [Hexamita inflata]